MKALTTLLVANRGEISARISRACHELDIDTLAIYAKEDAMGFHRQVEETSVQNEIFDQFDA